MRTRTAAIMTETDIADKESSLSKPDEKARKPKFLRKPSPTQVLVLGYLGIILFGSFLLSLPFANRSGQWTPYIDALLT